MYKLYYSRFQASGVPNMFMYRKWFSSTTLNALTLITAGFPALAIAQASTSAHAATQSNMFIGAGYMEMGCAAN
jgi:uncharacterized protein YraI